MKLEKYFLLTLGVVITLVTVEACNEAICGPIVSKCMLIECCDCEMSDLTNCTCCRECTICLKSLYTECCSCVGLCPPPDPNDDLSKSSTVEDLQDPIPELFNVLTREEDVERRWTTYTFAVDLDKLLFAPDKKKDKNLKTTTDKKDSESKQEEEKKVEHVLGIRNCTVAYFAECTSLRKCKDACKSMGAAKYRWFHDHGCCECVGHSCFDYGLNSPKCHLCPEDQSNLYNDQWLDNSVYHMGSEKVSHADGYLDSH